MALEIHRLQVLKTYTAAVLDDHKDPGLDRLASLAAKIMSAEYAAISLVDLADLHVISTNGFLGVDTPHKVPRKGSFGAAVINIKEEQERVLHIPDTLQDKRFCQIPLVTEAPHIRSCMGAPLISPEGYKIGSMCVFSTTPRPLHSNNNTDDDCQDALLDLAATAMRLLVDLRYRQQTQQNKEHVLACTSHDVLTPLTGLQLSISLLQDDAALQAKLDEAQRELVQTASSCANVMTRIFQTTIDTLRGDCFPCSHKTSSSGEEDNNIICPMVPHPQGGSSSSRNLPGLVNCLHQVSRLYIASGDIAVVCVFLATCSAVSLYYFLIYIYIYIICRSWHPFPSESP